MKKKIVSELLIIALLTVVIVITLRMVIYDFIPNENTLPKSIEYSADEIVEATLREIAEIKLPDLNAYTVEEAMKIVEGTALNMGVKVSE